MNRKLGPWVWCFYCHNYKNRRRNRDVMMLHLPEDVCVVQRARMCRDSTTGKRFWSRREDVDAHIVKNRPNDYLCSPRLTITGHIRRLLGLPIGESDD